jgi:dihydrofolate reductase
MMKKIQLYIAVTLDGFIARENGSLDWLLELPNPNKIDHGYGDFIKAVDTLIMGRKTYDVVLGFGIDWPYANCKTYVVTGNPDYKVSTENTFLLHELHTGVIDGLKSESQKNIWVVGGGDLISQFLNEDAMDEMVLCMIPIILGKGIPLFPNEPMETKFDLVKAESFETGIVNLTYRRKL